MINYIRKAMIINLKTILASLLLIISFYPVFSQRDFYPSYIINRQADTIYGMGSLGRAQLILHFKAEGSETVQELKANEVREFRIIDGRYFVSKEITEPDGILRRYFLEKLIDGKIDLYAINKGTRFFIEKEDEEIVELISEKVDAKAFGRDVYLIRDRTYTGYLRAYMHETPQLFPRIDGLKTLNRNIMVNLTRDYNRLMVGDNMTDYTRFMQSVVLKAEAVGGYNFHNEYYSPFGGFVFHISRPLVSERFFIRVGILHSDRPHYKKDRVWNNAWRAWQVVNKDPDPGIKIPFSVQYIFGNGLIKPTLSYGFPTGIYLISSVQGGFAVSISKRNEIHISGSIDGPFRYILGDHKELFDNNLAHSFSFSWAYRLK
jgi:hypothetical protein